MATVKDYIEWQYLLAKSEKLKEYFIRLYDSEIDRLMIRDPKNDLEFVQKMLKSIKESTPQQFLGKDIERLLSHARLRDCDKDSAREELDTVFE